LQRRRSKSSGVLLKKDFGSVEKPSVVMEAPKRYRHAMAELFAGFVHFSILVGQHAAVAARLLSLVPLLQHRP
jgi:hypothetical protein